MGRRGRHRHSHSRVHHYHGVRRGVGIRRRSSGSEPDDPLYLYNNPMCWRLTSWVVPVAILTGIALLITYFMLQNETFLIIGGVLLFYSVCFGVIVSTKCCSVGSVKFYMLPCIMSSEELQTLKVQCQAKHDLMFGVPVQVVQTSVLNQVQVPVVQNNQQVMQAQIMQQIHTVEMQQKPIEITMSAVM
ncbi:Hypothetical_protein [Hexamita inflata]|uniref:Hypothetical_protein n=1 Tax=Hexamita inflata TaxID=28002 RepID=A0AA86N673_9EUKA|nr:Hypothetical protein HINF_LOCUS1151 [Hexamita inflata]CAI9919027.1 Hypothetical protein HINF_LOCUS6672 [Hexamita inflata]